AAISRWRTARLRKSMAKGRSRGRVEVAVRFKRHRSGSRCAKAKTPAPDDAGVRCHRHPFDRVIPWLVARQQSQPPFHPARAMLTEAHATDKSSRRCRSGRLAKV